MPDWLNYVCSFLTSNGFTAFTNAIGVIGFVITIFVMVGVRQIRAHYSSLVRVPALRQQLEHRASQFSVLLNDFEGNTEHIRLEMSKTLPVLSAIKKHLKWSETNTLSKTIKALNTKHARVFTVAEVRSIFNNLHMILAELEQWEDDKKWSK